MRDEDSEQTSRGTQGHATAGFSRRGYLKAAAGVAGLYAAGPTAAAATKYDTITVSAGEHRDISVGSGETFANKLIDISASGATVRIHASGSNWVIRNVGIKGVWDVATDGHQQAISCRVDSGSTGTIENFYFADGTTDDTYPGVTGIYVQSSHAGTLQINNINIQDTPNNAIYASTPGYPENNAQGLPAGGQGTVEITDSYAADCLASHFRLGTSGSFVKNSVSVGGDRGVWVKFNDVDVVDCDLSGAATSRADGDVVAGENVDWGQAADPTANVQNTCFGTCAPGDQGINYPGTVSGSAASRSTRTQPSEVQGVPTSAAEAAAGGTSSSGGSSGSGSSTGGSTTTTAEFRIETANSAPSMEYQFTIDGDIVGGTGLEDSDTWSTSNGQTTATGHAGHGYADAYEIQGDLVDWSANVSADYYTILLDGKEVDPKSFQTPESTLRIETTSGAPTLEYQFTIDGDIVGGTGLEASDTWTTSGGQTTATGSAGNGYADAYQIKGQLVDWSANISADYYTVLVDGEPVDVGTVGSSSSGSTTTNSTTSSSTSSGSTTTNSTTSSSTSSGSTTDTSSSGSSSIDGFFF